MASETDCDPSEVKAPCFAGLLGTTEEAAEKLKTFDEGCAIKLSRG